MEGKPEMKPANSKIKTALWLCRQLHHDEKGATAIEYALIGALIFMVIVSSVQLFASSANGMYQYFSTIVSAAIS
jgi:Flp pilus assembly pilin Flp